MTGEYGGICGYNNKMATLKFKVGAAVAFFVAVALVGINLTAIFGHVAAIIIAGGVFIGSFYRRAALAERAGVVVNPTQEKAIQEGLQVLALAVLIWMAVYPGAIPWVLWMGIGHFVISECLIR